MSFSETEYGATDASDTGQRTDDGGLRFAVGGTETPRVLVATTTGALRVLGAEDADGVTVRALKPNGETVPLELVAEVQLRQRRGAASGEISIRARPSGDIQRQMRRLTKSFEFGRGDIAANLGEMIDTLASLKTVGNQIDRIRLEVTVPRRCDLTLTTVSGPIQAGRVAGNVQVQTASGPINCARIDGKLSARSMSGPIHVGDITGTASIQTASGAVATRGIDGNLVIQTMSGDAQGQNLAGQVGFKSQSGALTVREGRLTGFYINTTSGDCTIESALAPGEYEVRTVSGDVSLRPQADLSAILGGRTVSGAFRSTLPYRHAGEDWRAEMDDDDDRRGGFDAPEISLPGLRIGKEGIDVGGFLRIDEELLTMPGVQIELRKDRREKRRGRNRWEYLIGDPALAAEGETRLRVRTVSGDLTIRPGRGETPARTTDRAPERPTSPEPTRASRGWPDSELWPETGPIAPPVPPVAPISPLPPIPPIPPVVTAPPAPPTPPAPPAMPQEALRAETAAPAESDADDTADTLRGVEAERGDDTRIAAAAAPVAESPATATAAGEAEEPEADSERMRLDVLEALRRGELTTDEALVLLRQIDG